MNTFFSIVQQVPVREQLRRILVGFAAPAGSAERRYARDALLQIVGPAGVSLLGSILVAWAATFIRVGDDGRLAGALVPGPIIEIVPTEVRAPENIDMEPAARPEPEPERNRVEDPVVNLLWNSGPHDRQAERAMKELETFNSETAGSPGGLRESAREEILSLPVNTRSVAVLKGLPGRSDTERALALEKYGFKGGGGGCMAGAVTEGAVMKALRWLKTQQQSDGSWKNTKPAMTGLAILAYLAHNETPSSREFGQTVEGGLRWLLENQEANGHFKGRDAHDYSHPIATYALCEAYGMRKIPALKAAAEKAVAVLIKGQHPGGGWDYNCRQSDRDDTSYMGWCIQALKAASVARLENEGLKEAMRRAVTGLKRNADAGSGKFGYTSGGDGNGGLTGVGVLCLQMLGAGRDPEARKGLLWLQNATCDWEKPWLTSPIYYWYYVTQAKFQGSGEIWNEWNAKFATQLVRNQKTVAKAIKGPDGQLCDIGWWDPPADFKGHSDGPVMDTALCTLQLEVYYRYLPTFQVMEHDRVAPRGVDDDLKIVTTVCE